MKDLYKSLENIGIKVFSEAELLLLFNSFINQIPSNEFSILSNQYLVKRESSEDIQKGYGIIACAFAGTNWIVSHAKKTDSDIDIRDLTRKSFTDSVSRRFTNFDSFISEMGNLIIKGLSNTNSNISTIAVALGFPHVNVNTENGVDAKLIDQKLAKSWEIEYGHTSDGKSPLIGDCLLRYLHKKGIKDINKIYILNDTLCVAQGSCVGFVFGTGTNMAIQINEDLWNTEFGKISIPDDIASKDLVLNTQKSLGYLGNNRNIVEAITGGDYMHDRIAISIDLLIEEGFDLDPDMHNWIRSSKGIMISMLADRSIGNEVVINKFDLSISSNSLDILRDVVSLVMHQTAQVIGVMIASGLYKLPFNLDNELKFPVEGALFFEAFGVKDTSINVASNLLKMHFNTGTHFKLLPYKFSGIKGVSMFAMQEDFC